MLTIVAAYSKKGCVSAMTQTPPPKVVVYDPLKGEMTPPAFFNSVIASEPVCDHLMFLGPCDAFAHPTSLQAMLGASTRTEGAISAFYTDQIIRLDDKNGH